MKLFLKRNDVDNRLDYLPPTFYLHLDLIF